MQKGSKHSEETKRKMREARKGKYRGKENSMYGSKHSEETIRKMREMKKGEKHPMWGRHHSIESRQKMHKAHIGIQAGNKHPMWGKKHSEESIQKIRASKIGQRHSRDTKQKMSKTRLKRKEKLGYLLSTATRQKIGDILRGRKSPEGSEAKRGEKNPQWRGGISFEPYGIEFNRTLKRQIRKRDNYTCQECKHTEEQLGYELGCHHIDYDKKNNVPENLIALCQSCHSQTNFKREDWTNHFGEKIKYDYI